MKTKKTLKQILAEIETLSDMKESVRRFSAFGDDNKAAIEAQILVLQENLSFEDIDVHAEAEEWRDYVKDCADEARQWMDGEPEAQLSGNWKGLVQ